MKNMKASKAIRTILKIFVILLIALGMGIAILNTALSGKPDSNQKILVYRIYMYYEHYFRAATVILGALLTFALVKAEGKKMSRSRKNMLLSLSGVSFVFLILLPLASGYYELYNSYMPFPWSTLPFQLLDSGKYFSHTFEDFRGIDGTTILLWTYLLYQIIVFTGTLILGRRWHCSLICMMNGIHAETLGEVLPFLHHNRENPKSKRINPKVRAVLRKVQIILFCLNLFLIAAWTIILLAGESPLPGEILKKMEQIKYLSVELTLLMFLWVFISARGYCYYCPAGYALGILGKMAGQRIETNLTKCISCGSCDNACKMSIDIQAYAEKKKPIRTAQCVGCGLCVEACPTHNLRYSTSFLRRRRIKRMLSDKERDKNQRDYTH